MVDLDSLKIGEMQLEKGLIRREITMFAWDGIRDCNSEEGCPVVDMCKYLHKGKCAVQVKYLESLYKAVLGTYSYLDEAMLFKVGMQIVPLYVQLVRLQIVELSLRTPMSFTDKGTPFVHPIYKEIRETLKTIAIMWKDLDLTFNFGEAVVLSGKKKNPNIEAEEVKAVDYERGDPNFYKRISQEGPSQKGIIR